MRKLTIAFMLLLATVGVNASVDADKEAVAKRIAPVGQVYVAGAVVIEEGPREPRTGQQVYQRACFACHATGTLDAPKLGSAEDWKPRLAQGFDVLLQHSKEGLGNMPPMGTCTDCTDEELSDAIKFMTDGV